MKARILNSGISNPVRSTDQESLYVMDFQDRTQSKRGIECSCDAFVGDVDLGEIPTQPLRIENPTRKNIHFTAFPCNVFGVGVKNSEGCVFSDHADSFALFVEIKDCKVKNISDHFQKAKQQIIDTVDQFRAKNILLPRQKVYAVISFPRRTKTAFNDLLFSSPIGTKEDFKTKKIIIAGTNKVKVVDQMLIEHIL